MRHEYEKLNNPPIEEAIISLTIGKEKYASLDSMSLVFEEISQSYPEYRGPIHQKMLHIHEPTTISYDDKPAGYTYASKDQKSVIFLFPDTLSLHQLKPYESWNHLAQEYHSLWEIFTQPLNVLEISNLSVRYVNKFDIPSKNWQEYLLMYPTLNNDMNFDRSTISTSELFCRYVLHSTRHIAQAHVLLTITVKNKDSLQVIMDIEAQSKDAIKNYMEYESVNDVLDRLCNFKNQIFFSNIKAKELFQ